jgi:mRNA turnover protein 4
MPKSKRERKSALTQVQKKTRAVKESLVTKIRAAVEELPYVYVFRVSHMKNSQMKSVREQWPGSKFFLGKNKVMQLALGKTPQDELKPGLAKLSQQITGDRGLLATDRSEAEVAAALEGVSETHFARSGFKATGNYKLAAGTLPADRCPHPMEPMLRRLGLPTKLVQVSERTARQRDEARCCQAGRRGDRCTSTMHRCSHCVYLLCFSLSVLQGRVELLNDVNVCRKGDILTPEQCKILEIFGVKLAKFNLEVLYLWKDGSVQELPAAAAGEDEDEELEEGKEGEDDEGIELRTAGGDFDGAFLGGEDEEAADEDEEME